MARLSVHCRLLGGPVDLTALLQPDCVAPLGGFLIASDRSGACALHLNLERLHAFSIQWRLWDVMEASLIQLHDNHGRVTFELAVDDPALANLWRAMCDASEASNQPPG